MPAAAVNSQRADVAGHCAHTYMLQRAAVWCSEVQCGAVCCSVLQCGAVWCSVVQCAAVCCSALQCVAVSCRALQCAAVGQCGVLILDSETLGSHCS